MLRVFGLGCNQASGSKDHGFRVSGFRLKSRFEVQGSQLFGVHAEPINPKPEAAASR